MTGIAIVALSCAMATWNQWRWAGQELWRSPALISLSAHPAKPGPGAGEGPVERSQLATHPLPVLLSIEPVGATADSDVEAPVVFPGYLLPDDNREEPAHGGS